MQAGSSVRVVHLRVYLSFCSLSGEGVCVPSPLSGPGLSKGRPDAPEELHGRALPTQQKVARALRALFRRALSSTAPRLLQQSPACQQQLISMSHLSSSASRYRLARGLTSRVVWGVQEQEPPVLIQRTGRRGASARRARGPLQPCWPLCPHRADLGSLSLEEACATLHRHDPIWHLACLMALSACMQGTPFLAWHRAMK